VTQKRSQNLPFKPRARLLLLLGDQLIREPGIAVFELVKNAYDADSPDATITMTILSDIEHSKIVVQDSGVGMDFETVTQVWLEPGTDFRAQQRIEGRRTEKYHRLPLGEKGVGRFAAHKLGSYVTLITRKKDHSEVMVNIDWRKFTEHRYLEEIPVNVIEREPEIFKGNNTGTRIEIAALRNEWTRGMVRDLFRSVTSICSPFDKKGEFKARLILTENKDWLKGLKTVNEMLEFALFRAKCKITENLLTYEYEFEPFPSMDKVGGRTAALTINIDVNGNLISKYVGPVNVDLYIFDRDPSVLALGVSDKKGLKEFLDTTGGIRVYRDGIRVYDYGEPGNDWLNLGARRVNIPTKRISNNIVIGAVSLDLDKSTTSEPENSFGLIEKTNREGFVDNTTYREFKDAVYFAVKQIEHERDQDKTRIRNAYSGKKNREPVLYDLTELKKIVEKKKLTRELGPYIDRIETDFLAIRDKFLTSASAGLSLSVVIHEVEKGIDELVRAVKEEQVSTRIQLLAKHIADLVEGFASLIRKSGQSLEKAGSLISQALFNTDLRLKAHKVSQTVDYENCNFQIKCSRRLIISTLMNLIDNSIWWLNNKWGKDANNKRIYIGTTNEFSYGPAIVVADNGPGFYDPPEYLIEPFISRKPDGMGLGLHLADQVLKGHGGRLIFPDPDDISLPSGFDGAVVAMVFG